MHRNAFMGQRENLCNVFYEDRDMRLGNGETPAHFDGWYKNRVHRWQSAAYSMGVVLKQPGNVLFAEMQRKDLEQFRYPKIKPERVFSVETAPIAGLLCGILLRMGLRYLLRRSGIRTLLCAIAVAAATTGFWEKRTEVGAKKSDRICTPPMQAGSVAIGPCWSACLTAVRSRERWTGL